VQRCGAKKGKEYAWLLNLDDKDGAGSSVLMRLVEQGEQAIFQTIDDDEEFGRAQAFIKTVANKMDEEREGDI
jgi:hypothetical protein